MSKYNNNFENIALKYSNSVDTKPIHIYYERPNLLSLLAQDLNNLKILDLGCGSGWYAEYLINSGAHVTAIDNSPTMVTLTKQRLKDIGKVEFYHHTLHELSEALSINGFVIEKMLEPQPLPEMKLADPKMYDNLSSKPWFLFVRAIKKKLKTIKSQTLQ